MKHQSTSRDAFHELVASGKQHTRQQEVLWGIHQLPYSTANEVFEYLKETLGVHLRYDSNTRARFTELRTLGLVKNTGKRRCQITGIRCLLWAPVEAA